MKKTVVVAISALMFAAPAWAQDVSASEELVVSEGAGSGWFWQIFGAGMWPLWLLSIILLTLIFERAKAMRRAQVIDESAIDAAIEQLSQGQTDAAIQRLDGSPARLSQAWAQGLRVYQRGREPLAGALTTTSTLALKPLKKNVTAISTIGVIAPLLGLLGTVLGMIMVFSQLAMTGGGDKAALAGGIGLALFTTVGGLIIAIPAIVAGRYFNNKLMSYAEEIELAINRADYNVPHGKPDEKPARASSPKPAVEQKEASS